MTADVIDTGVTVAEAYSVPASAWARLWARLFDTWLMATVIGAAVGVLWPDLIDAIESDALFGVMLLPCALVLEAAVYAAFGKTPGKALVGIDLAMIGGDRVPFPTLLRRQIGVWFYGLALGIPIVALFTYMANEKKLAAHKLTKWDEQNFTRVTGQPSAVRLWVAALTWLTFAIGVTMLGKIGEEMAQPLDANSSEATIADKLEAFAASGRSGLPTQVDAVTRLDDVTADGAKRLTYHYTITNMAAGEMTVADASVRMRARLNGSARQWYCEDLDQLGLRAAGVAVRYAYADPSGNPIARVIYTPSDCTGRRR